MNLRQAIQEFHKLLEEQVIIRNPEDEYDEVRTTSDNFRITMMLLAFHEYLDSQPDTKAEGGFEGFY